MTDFEGQVLADLQVLKSQVDQLLGVGQPGRLHEIESRISATERTAQRLKGGMGLFGAMVTVLQLAINYFGGKHI